MGRRTWESLPPARRPLKGRLNVVLTGRDDPDNRPPQYVRAITVEHALDLCDYCETWVIGGAQVYEAFLPLVREIHLTEVAGNFPDADTFMPGWPFDDWEHRIVGEVPGARFKTLTRRP